MKIPKEGQLLRIFIGENNKFEGKLLYEWLVLEAKKHGLAGATVIRGIMGFGANSRIHTSKILRLSLDLPIIVEIIDTPEKIKNFLACIENTIQDGLITIEKAVVQFYKSNDQNR